MTSPPPSDGQIAHLRDYANLLAVEEATGSPVS